MLTIADEWGRGIKAIADEEGRAGLKNPKLADIICGQPLTHKVKSIKL